MRVDKVNSRVSPIQDDYIEAYLSGYKAKTDEDIKNWRAGCTSDIETVSLDLHATLDWQAGYRDADFIVIAAPTYYDTQKIFLIPLLLKT